MARLLRRVAAEELQAQGPSPRDPEAAAVAGRIVEDVRESGEAALRGYAERFDGLAPGAPLTLRVATPSGESEVVLTPAPAADSAVEPAAPPTVGAGR